MRLTLIGKYPPIEGGVSSRTYWLARGLGERGVEVSVVTNGDCVEEGYREKMDVADHDTQHAYQPKNVTVFSLQGHAPRHIPYSESYVSRLASLALSIIGKRGSDVVYAHYLEPYGVTALLVHKLTGLPYAVKHAGSDIHRLLTSPQYMFLLGRVMTHAQAVFLGPSLSSLSKKLHIRAVATPPQAVHPLFSPEGKRFDFLTWAGVRIPAGVPVVTFIGKAAKNKGLFEICEALKNSPELSFHLVLVTGGEEKDKIQKIIEESPSLKERTTFLGFIPPWEVPSLLRATDVLLNLEYNFPVPIHAPVVALEGIACGTPLLVSREMYQKIEALFPRGKKLFTIIENPADSDSLRAKLSALLKDIQRARTDAHVLREEFTQGNSWEAYVDGYLRVFTQIAQPSLFSRARLRRFLSRVVNL